MNAPQHIDPNSRDHPYQQLARLLRHRIENGDLKKMERLPSIAELTREYKLSVGPVRRALALLVADNVIEIVPQRGTFKADPTRPGGPSQSPARRGGS